MKKAALRRIVICTERVELSIAISIDILTAICSSHGWYYAGFYNVPRTLDIVSSPFVSFNFISFRSVSFYFVSFVAIPWRVEGFFSSFNFPSLVRRRYVPARVWQITNDLSTFTARLISYNAPDRKRRGFIRFAAICSMSQGSSKNNR